MNPTPNHYIHLPGRYYNDDPRLVLSRRAADLPPLDTSVKPRRALPPRATTGADVRYWLSLLAVGLVFWLLCAA